MIAVPRYVQAVCAVLAKQGFQVYLVGGAVRDSLLSLKPTDWDVSTNARPEQIESLFPKTKATGKRFGTVTVFINAGQLEVTTMRVDGPYTDGRHPEQVHFTDDLAKDLSRRDFTINALAYHPFRRQLIDPYQGRRDLRKKRLRAVGNPAQRFQEDPLRMLRLLRFQATLGFGVEKKTRQAIFAPWIREISKERIQVELSKLLLGRELLPALKLFYSLGLMGEVLPELAKTAAVSPGSRHPYDLLGHSLVAAHFAYPLLHLRWAALLHDLAKPHFPGREHAQKSAQMAGDILQRLRYSRNFTARVQLLIANHMFSVHPFSSAKAFRRFLAKVGEQNAFDLVKLRQADMAGMNQNPREILNYGQAMEDRLQQTLLEDAAFSLADLKIDGRILMQALGLSPGPLVGKVLRYLLDQVLTEPQLNERQQLLALARDFVQSKQ